MICLCSVSPSPRWTPGVTPGAVGVGGVGGVGASVGGSVPEFLLKKRNCVLFF